MVTPNLETAYLRKSHRLAKHDAQGRCDLVRWCLRHGLKEAAISEIETLAQQNPQHPQLRILGRQAREFRSDWKQTVLPRQAPLHPDQQYLKGLRNQLSGPTLAEFVRSVQPLLLNRCGQASCHGKATQTTYQLTRSPWAKVPRGITQRNLGASLRRIGAQAPRETVLWMSANSAHGTLRKKPLQDAQLRTLLAWIELANADLGGPRTIGSEEIHESLSEADLAPGIDPFDPSVFNADAQNRSTPTLPK